MKRGHSPQLWVALADKALASGGQKLSRYNVHWDVAPRCLAPVHREIYTARPTAGRRFDATGMNSEVRERTEGQVIEMDTRCRKCQPCLTARAIHWRSRAIVECEMAARTWFGTLTLSPAEHHRMKLLSCLRLDRQGVTFEQLSEGEQFALRHAEVSKELTKFLKRLRKQSGAKLRFICVAEAHKSGLPHYHMLVHEVLATQPVRHAQLSEQWKHGFSSWKLCSSAMSGYVCKYLAKSSIARVRASVGYGTHYLEETSGLPHNDSVRRGTNVTI